jgi:hypothetical protein
VIGVRSWARGFSTAQSRWATAMAPSCSLLVPYRSMSRRAAMAYIWLALVISAAAASPRHLD